MQHILHIKVKSAEWYYSRISALEVRKVIVLAISREQCVFHVNGMWMSTRERGSGSCGQKPNFLWTS